MDSWFCLYPTRVLFDPRLLPSTKLLYAALLVWDRDKRSLTQVDMASELGMSRRGVTGGLAELVKAGLIQRRRRGKGKNRGADPSETTLIGVHVPPSRERVYDEPRSGKKPPFPRPDPADVQWADAVKTRDGGCVVCGSIEGLAAHHIKPRATHPELARDLDNGAALCNRCHPGCEKGFGAKFEKLMVAVRARQRAEAAGKLSR